MLGYSYVVQQYCYILTVSRVHCRMWLLPPLTYIHTGQDPMVHDHFWTSQMLGAWRLSTMPALVTTRNL